MSWYYVSIAGNVLLMLVVIGFLFLLNRSGKIINQYEKFYQQTLLEAETHVTHIQKLMSNNAILSDDDDVKQLFKSMKGFYQIILGYFNAGSGTARQK